MKKTAITTTLLCGASLLTSAPAFADEGGGATFDTEYTGTFTMSFGTGPGYTHELDFSGSGQGTQIGLADVDGSSLLQSIDASCMEIVDDLIVMTAANGDEVHVVAAAIDCLEFTAEGPRIVGSGTWEVIGGTGRFADATGGGTQTTVAPIYVLGAGSGSGVFTLNFEGVIDHGE
jgi:hypothetical protein